jgi:hypothetical protein
MVITEKTKMSWYINGLHFECRQCGKCCSGPQEGVIWISRPEIKMLAERLGLSTSELRKKYLKRLGFHFSIRENPCSNDCIFLANLNGFKGCAIYDVRPMQCRNWPFWPANLDSPDDWNIAAAKCPGINPAPIVPGPNQEKNDSTGVERSGFDFAATRNNRCGVNKGRLYTFDEIQKIQKQKYWWNNTNKNKKQSPSDSAGSLAPTPVVGVQSRDSSSLRSPATADNGAVTIKICEQVRQIYSWLDSNIKPLNNQCIACGKCCRFDSFGHKLFVTTPELLFFYRNIKNLKRVLSKIEEPMLTQSCPYLNDDKCSVRNYRFAGCRIFFCKSAGGCLTAADKDLQNKLSEAVVEKFKALCDKFDFPYRYVDLMTALNNPELAKIVAER